MWENMAERLHITARRMHFACWIPNAADKHSEYVIFIVFVLHQWVRESASMLCYTYSTLPVWLGYN